MPKVSAITVWFAVLVLALAAQTARSQTLDAATTGALRDLAAEASVIFAGQVISVVHRGSHGAYDDAQGVVEISFRVEAAVRGASAGETYVLREWAGLWCGRAPPYVPGQRLLMLLATPRDGRGLAAPVGGTDGAVPLHATTQPPLLDARGNAPRDATSATSEARLTASLVADLRWVQARATLSPGGRASLAANSRYGIAPAGLGDVLAVLAQPIRTGR